jgi:hypothetical protein
MYFIVTFIYSYYYQRQQSWHGESSRKDSDLYSATDNNYGALL